MSANDNQTLVPEIVTSAAEEEFNIAGCIHPLRPEMTVKGKVPIGTKVGEAIAEACKSASVRKRFMRRGIAQIGTRDIEAGVTRWVNVPQNRWNTRRLKKGELLRFRLLPQGGGGGNKNPLRVILQVVVAVVAVVAAVWTGGASLPAVWGMTASQTATLAGGLVGLAVTTIGMALVNAVAPIKPPSVRGLGDRQQESKVYSINSGRNGINQWGVVPVPLGQGRFSPPKAAIPYIQTIGEDQYLHELYCLGIGDKDISQIMLGGTPISDFDNVQYEIFTYSPQSPYRSSLFPSGIYEEPLSVQLKKSDGWANRRTSECERIEIDLSFQGLGYFNDDGGIDERCVSFLIQYKSDLDTDWSQSGTTNYVHGANLDVDSYEDGDYIVVLSLSGALSILPYYRHSSLIDSVVLKAFNKNKAYTLWGERSYDLVEIGNPGPTTSSKFYVDGFSVNLHHSTHVSYKAQIDESLGVGWEYYWEDNCHSGGDYCNPFSYYVIHPYVSISGGNSVLASASSSTLIEHTICGKQSTLLRKTISIGPVPRGFYDLRIMRKTEDSTNDRERTDSYWTALRSISNDSPVNTPYPVQLLALKIRATGQLSGSVDTLSVMYHTKILDWDKNSNTWVHRYTSNPASIARNILQNPHALARPQRDALLDLPSFQEAHNYWAEKRWNWNLVCDSSVGMYERLQSVFAAGLASPTAIDGKWAPVIDRPRSHVSMALTSANSWGWAFRRTQIRLPNEIHCNFINEEIWDTDLRIVKTDEPLGTDYLYESQPYEGVTNAGQVYYLARYHYADAKVHRRTITCTCYDEALLCTRGDLVDCAVPNISPQGLQVGRIRKVIRDVNSNVISFTTDQTQTTDFSGRRFGIKIYNQVGAILHAEINAENRTSRVLTLKTPQPMDINFGDKYAFGDYDEETFPAIVVGMRYNPDWTCELTLQDYTPQIYGALDLPIPPFQSIITDPIYNKWQIKAQPIVIGYVADESVLLKYGSTFIPRILINYKHPLDLDYSATFVQFEIQKKGEVFWKTVARNEAIESINFFIQDVEEKATYTVRMRYVGNSGEVGPWTYIHDIYIVGRTSPPPPVTKIFINNDVIYWEMPEYVPPDVVGWEVWMTFDEKDPFSAGKPLTNGHTTLMNFNISKWSGWARRIWVTTIDDLGLRSEPRSIVINLGDVQVGNVIYTISEKERNWPGEIISGELEDESKCIDAVDNARYWVGNYW